MEPQTQKAKGIRALANFSIKGFTNEMVRDAKVYPMDSMKTFPFFARPCPKVPRHGFVESRVVANLQDWMKLLAEVEATKEPVEIVQMPFIHCQFSGVMTEHGISYGPGNDGVTGGQAARSIQASCPSRAEWLKTFGMAAAADVAQITHSPYLEFVEYNGNLEAVQLRNGPEVPIVNRYVPKAMLVEHVVQPTDMEAKYLLAWEEKMQGLKGKAGIVVWYPGGSMHSHVAVQAIEQTKGTEHPFAVWLDSTPPVIGTVLQPDNAVEPLTLSELQELSKMLASAITTINLEDETNQKYAIQLAVAALHASPYWTGARHLLVLRAVAVSAMLRFASAAVLGELRHWNGSGPGKYQCLRRTTPLDEKERLGQLNRDQVYERAFRLHVSLISPRLGTAYLDFKTKGWNGSYGGKKWADCTRGTIDLFNACAGFIAEPTLDRWQAVMAAWNLVVNTFHNTGKFLNKFISTSVMDTLAKVPVAGLANAMVGQLTVRDEDFPLHRNATRIAEELFVVIPKVVKPKPVLLPPVAISAEAAKLEFEARWRFKSQTTLYIQIKLPVGMTKEYGQALDLVIPSPKLRKVLHGISPKAASLGGTPTLYSKGTIRVQEQWVLIIEDVNLWVPLPSQRMQEIVAAISAGAQVGDLED